MRDLLRILNAWHVWERDLLVHVVQIEALRLCRVAMQIPLRRVNHAVREECLRADVGFFQFSPFDVFFLGLSRKAMHFLVQFVSSME